MTQAIRSRGGFIATMLLTVILAFPLARWSTAQAIGERSTETPHTASERLLPTHTSEESAISMPDGTREIGSLDMQREPIAISDVAPSRAPESPGMVCRIDWTDGRNEVRRLVRCAARHFGVSVRTALYVADRESNFHARAYNASSCAKGIFQHLCTYWPERAQDFGFRGWSAFNARANIMVAMKMVRRYGWEPWGG